MSNGYPDARFGHVVQGFIPYGFLLPRKTHVYLASAKEEYGVKSLAL